MWDNNILKNDRDREETCMATDASRVDAGRVALPIYCSFRMSSVYVWMTSPGCSLIEWTDCRDIPNSGAFSQMTLVDPTVGYSLRRLNGHHDACDESSARSRRFERSAVVVHASTRPWSFSRLILSSWLRWWSDIICDLLWRCSDLWFSTTRLFESTAAARNGSLNQHFRDDLCLLWKCYQIWGMRVLVFIHCDRCDRARVLWKIFVLHPSSCRFDFLNPQDRMMTVHPSWILNDFHWSRVKAN